MADTLHAGVWTIEDLCESTWHYLPFEVGPGATAVRVELEYDSSAAVLDLGCFGPSGFRGWSGSARQFFVLSPQWATPGYLPGELEPGTWQVAIGLYRVPAAGVSYSVSAEVSLGQPATWTSSLIGGDQVPSAADRPGRRELPAATGMRWLAGDLHTHTVHSDGALTVPELARFATGRGLDFLAITDHNTVSHHAELPAAAAAHGITLLPGQEVTTDRGHANALGDLPWVDFRNPPDDWLAATERDGGLLCVNHPYGGPVSWTAPMSRRPPLIEVWHWSWLDLRWTTPFSWWLAWYPGAIAVGGSDWHRPGSDAPPGSPTTWVLSEAADPAAVLDGIKAGRVAVSANRDGPVLLRVDDELVAVDADGAILVGPDGPKTRVRGDIVTLGDAKGSHRLIDPTGATLALTS
jgi:PHP domain